VPGRSAVITSDCSKVPPPLAVVVLVLRLDSGVVAMGVNALPLEEEVEEFVVLVFEGAESLPKPLPALFFLACSDCVMDSFFCCCCCGCRCVIWNG